MLARGLDSCIRVAFFLITLRRQGFPPLNSGRKSFRWLKIGWSVCCWGGTESQVTSILLARGFCRDGRVFWMWVEMFWSLTRCLTPVKRCFWAKNPLPSGVGLTKRHRWLLGIALAGLAGVPEVEMVIVLKFNGCLSPLKRCFWVLKSLTVWCGLEKVSQMTSFPATKVEGPSERR
jgi:hypothetical protein